MASDLCIIALVGRLTADAKLSYLQSGTPVVKFSVARSRRVKKSTEWIDETSFYDVVLWGKQGEAINQYLTKGKQVAISGDLVQQRWEKDGQKHSRHEIIANTVQLLGGGKKSDGSSNTDHSADYSDSKEAVHSPANAVAEAFGGSFVDDIF